MSFAQSEHYRARELEEELRSADNQKRRPIYDNAVLSILDPCQISIDCLIVLDNARPRSNLIAEGPYWDIIFVNVEDKFGDCLRI